MEPWLAWWKLLLNLLLVTNCVSLPALHTQILPLVLQVASFPGFPTLEHKYEYAERDWDLLSRELERTLFSKALPICITQSLHSGMGSLGTRPEIKPCLIWKPCTRRAAVYKHTGHVVTNMDSYMVPGHQSGMLHAVAHTVQELTLLSAHPHCCWVNSNSCTYLVGQMSQPTSCVNTEHSLALSLFHEQHKMWVCKIKILLLLM